MRHETPATANARLIGEAVAGAVEAKPPYRHREVIVTVTSIDGAPLTRYRVGMSDRTDLRIAEGIGDILADYARTCRPLEVGGGPDAFVSVRDQVEASLRDMTDGPDRIEEAD